MAVAPGVANRAVVVRPKDGDRAVAEELVVGDKANVVARMSGAVADSSSRVDSITVAMEMVVATARVETGADRVETRGTKAVASREAGVSRAVAGDREAAISVTILATITSRDTVPAQCAQEDTRTSGRHHTVIKVGSEEAAVMETLEATVGIKHLPTEVQAD